MCILLTRAEHRQINLKTHLSQLGYPFIELPLTQTTSILSPSKQQQNHHLLDNIEYDKAIFVSVNAVEFLIQDYPLPLAKQYFAIGPATAQRLSHYMPSAIPITCAPPPYNSEALLSLSDFNRVDSQSILIINGADGREKLKSHLQASDAQVACCMVYQRYKTPNIENKFATLITHQKYTPSIIIAASGSSLHILSHIFQSTLFPNGYNLPTIVPGKRLVNIAKHLGFTQVIGIDFPNDQLVLSAINSIKQNR